MVTLLPYVVVLMAYNKLSQCLLYISDAVLDVPLTHVQEFNNERTPGPVPPGAYKDQVCCIEDDRFS